MLKKRIHLFEIEDQFWLPHVLRKGVTDFLQKMIEITGVYDPVLPMILELSKNYHNKVVDLCSGTGGPWLRWSKKFNNRLPEVTLTDKFPSPELSGQLLSRTIQYLSTPVSATSVPDDLSGVRTLFTSFHHFKLEHGKNILKDAVQKKVPIAIFESNSRHPAWFGYCLLLPIICLLSTPTIRPISFSKLFFTYLIPFIPLIIFFDGIVSGLRTYSVEELQDLTKDLESTQYTFEIGEKRIDAFGFFKIIYLIGKPLI